MVEAQAYFRAIQSGNVGAIRSALVGNPDLVHAANASCFDYRLLNYAATQDRRDFVELALEFGARIDERSRDGWTALQHALIHDKRAMAEYLVNRGAMVDVHSASALPDPERLKMLLDADPQLVHERGGDGCTPLHFARTVEVAEILCDCGADLDALDEDHRSTPAQWLIQRAPDVARHLLHRGARPDVFLAAALGDVQLVQRVLDADPACVTYRIGNNLGPVPGIGFEHTGGTILQWQLGFNLSPQEVAAKRGRRDVYEMLMQQTPPKYKLHVACMLADRDLAKRLLAAHPGLIDEFDDQDRMLLAKACWETNNDTEAIRLMIDCGFPLGIPEHNHGYTPLHNAAWCGNAEVVRLLLQHGHPVDLVDPEYEATAFGYAVHSATEAKRHPDGDFGGVVDALIQFGLVECLKQYPAGHKAIDAVISKYVESRG